MSTPSTPSNPSRPRRRVSGIRRPRVAGRVTGSSAEHTPDPTPAGGIDVLDAGPEVDLVKHQAPDPAETGGGSAADPAVRSPRGDADEVGADVDPGHDGPDDLLTAEPGAEAPRSDGARADDIVDGTAATPEDGAEPRPSGKRLQRRRSASPDTEAGATAGRLAGLRGIGRAARRVPTAALAAVAVLLVALAAFFAVQSAQLRGTPSAQNTALVDVGTTAQVVQQVSDGLTKVYSFDYTRLDQNEAAARTVITPAFESSFQQLFKQVRDLAPQQKAVVSATVNMAAVRSITGDTAVLLVFLDQQATRAADNGQAQQLAAAGRLTVTAQLVDGTWKIANVVPQ